MKLLLTSNGFSNNSIKEAFISLLDKPLKEISFAFIPTASNFDTSHKDWLVNDINRCFDLKTKYFDLVDFSGLPEPVWRERLGRADVLMFGGGNTYHLAAQFEKTGVGEAVKEWVMKDEKVYCGISAGSMCAGPDPLLTSHDKKVYAEKHEAYNGEKGLEFIDWHFRPHYNSPIFPHATKEAMSQVAAESGKTIYAIDDQSAIKVVDSEVEVVSEGFWNKFN